MDATGEVVKFKDLTGKATFYYALTFKPSDIVSKKDAKENELSAFSYANYITTNNKTYSVTSFLMTFFAKVQEYSNKTLDKCRPDEVCTDFIFLMS